MSFCSTRPVAFSSASTCGRQSNTFTLCRDSLVRSSSVVKVAARCAENLGPPPNDLCSWVPNSLMVYLVLLVLLVACGWRNQPRRDQGLVYGSFRCKPVNLRRAKWHAPPLPMLVSKSGHELMPTLSKKVGREFDKLLSIYFLGLVWH